MTKNYVLINDMLFLIPNETSWDEYLKSVTKHIKNGKPRHFGIPVEFPCLVTSFYTAEEFYLEHRFIYCRDVRQLLEVRKETITRLSFLK